MMKISPLFWVVILVSILSQKNLFVQANENENEAESAYKLPEGLELELIVELSRHGERASKKIFNLTDGENFDVGSKELTRTGAVSHHAIGGGLKKEFDHLGYINTNAYNRNEVYVQSSYKERTIHSAMAQLEGLYARDVTWPATNITDFEINFVPIKDDKFMVISNETCKRFAQGIKALQ